MKKKKKTKTRSTTLKRIKAATTTSEQFEIAKHNRVRLPVERVVEQYLSLRRGETESERLRSKLDASLRDRLGAQLSKLLLNAVDACDWTCLQAAANTVKSFGLESEEVGSHYQSILAMKCVLNDLGQSMTIRRLASALGYPNSADGFSWLRRLCKRVDFPIKDSSKT